MDLLGWCGGEAQVAGQMPAGGGPDQEASCEPVVGAGLGEPGVEIGLGGGPQGPTVVMQGGEEFAAAAQRPAGVGGAVGHRGAGGGMGAEPGQDLPPQPALEDLAVAAVGESGEQVAGDMLEAIDAAALVGQRASSSSVSTDTPRKLVPSLDHLVTQWISQGMSSNSSSRNSAQVHASSLPTMPSIRKVQSSVVSTGVGPAVSTGKPASAY